MMAWSELGRQGLPTALAAAVSWIALAVLMRYADRLPQDRPNDRSLHARAIPRGAGLAIWTGWLAAAIWTATAEPWLVPLLGVIAVSLWDDWRGVPVAVR